MPKPKQNHKDERKREVVFEPAFVKAWRKYRKMTQEELASEAGMSTGNLSNIETGHQGYTQENLEALAPALGCHPADLVAGDPRQAGSILAIWERATDGERTQILKVAAALVDKAETPTVVAQRKRA